MDTHHVTNVYVVVIRLYVFEFPVELQVRMQISPVASIMSKKEQVPEKSGSIHILRG